MFSLLDPLGVATVLKPLGASRMYIPVPGFLMVYSAPFPLDMTFPFEVNEPPKKFTVNCQLKDSTTTTQWTLRLTIGPL